MPSGIFERRPPAKKIQSSLAARGGTLHAPYFLANFTRPGPALATCDAMCARDPCLRPDLQTAPATRARDVRVRDSRAQSARDPSATIVRRGMVASTERRGRKKTYDLQDPGVRMPIVAPKVYSVLRGTAPRECNGHALLNGAALQTPLEG